MAELMNSLLAKIVQADAEDYVATIVHVEGSSYRKEGAMMLFQSNGIRHGMLSVGCLEEDISSRIENDQLEDAQVLSFDMRAEDDLGWGISSGCNGIIYVLIERCCEQVRKGYEQILHELKLGKEITLFKRITDGKTPFKQILQSDGRLILNNWRGEIPSLVTAYNSASPLKNGRFINVELNETIYVQTFRPLKRLVIFGAGDDVIPLVQLAGKLDFYILLVDWREALLTDTRFSEANEKILIKKDELFANLEVKNEDFVIIMTHQFQQDQLILKGLLKKQLGYIGLLGSKNRTVRLLEGAPIPDFVYSPIGEMIKAEGPNEIAISIVAQLIKFKNTEPKKVTFYQ
ncbi:XdhC family protein [Alkalihalobacillus sp. 1P02AB]|uniref:XdhC family protein n=1 Tax=Alkalihalobacillus sp. 1P02AB TaxID=3132260 RepID=UPI0039A701AE